MNLKNISEYIDPMGVYVHTRKFTLLWECVCFGTVCDAIIFVLATDTTISRIMDRKYQGRGQYGPLFSQSFLDVYVMAIHKMP